MAARKKKAITFEEGMQALDALVEHLSDGELPLEEAMSLYEEGVALHGKLEEMLARQKRRMETIDPETAEIGTFEEDEHDVS